MKCTASGDYSIPSSLFCFTGNVLLHAARLVPPSLRATYLQRRAKYQTFDELEPADDQEGLSINKWKALRFPNDLRGKRVLDIGCSEGFFCRQCALLGASAVLGIDTNLGRLLCGTFMALEERLPIRYRMKVFSGDTMDEQFDIVLCLSVLHHSLVEKNIFKVLTSPNCQSDYETLRVNLGILRSLTKPGGNCIIEMPYEYSDPLERNEVDFKRFSEELVSIGFRAARTLGTWDYNPKYKSLKDRIIYVAEG